jgi:carboxyl-terminal processing protease
MEAMSKDASLKETEAWHEALSKILYGSINVLDDFATKINVGKDIPVKIKKDKLAKS